MIVGHAGIRFENTAALITNLIFFLSLTNSPPRHLAYQFCSYFADKIKTLFKTSKIDLNPLFLTDKSPPSFSSFKQVSVDEINQLILS